MFLTVWFFAETSDASTVKIQMECDYIKFKLFFYLIVTNWILFFYLFCNDTCHKMHFQWIVVFHHLEPDPLYYVVEWKKTKIFLFEDPVVVKSWWNTIISSDDRLHKTRFYKKRGSNHYELAQINLQCNSWNNSKTTLYYIIKTWSENT